MKGGVRNPAKYFIKSEAAKKIESLGKTDQLSAEKNTNRSRAASRSNKSRNGDE